LRPSGFISQNEIDAAKLVHLEYFNAQDQPRFVWPASFAVARETLAAEVRHLAGAGAGAGADR